MRPITHHHHQRRRTRCISGFTQPPSKTTSFKVTSSLTRRAEEHVSAELCGVAGVIYLPKLTHAQARTLLAGVRKPCGVDLPAGVGMAPSHHHVPAI